MKIKKYHPATWVPTLYFSEGLPFVATSVVSVLMYKSLGLSDSEIAFFTTLIMWPWTLKPLWGPLLEMFKTKKHFVIATQFIGGVAFGLLALTLPLEGFLRYSLVMFVIIAFNSATHDIAADGVYINSLSSKDQAKYVGWQGAFYNVAKVLSQGALVYIAGKLEIIIGVVEAWMIVMGLFGAILMLMGIYHLKMLPSGGSSTEVKNVNEAFTTFWKIVKSFFAKKYVFWGIAFIILFRTAEGQLTKIVPLFMRAAREDGGLGLLTADIGIAYGIFGAAAFVLGSIAGGYFIAKRGLKRSIFILAIIFNLPDVVYTYLAFTVPESFTIICTAITIEWFGYGFGFVGVILFMMQQIAPGPYKMAHYAFATAVMNLGFMLPSMVSGFISDYLGYKNFFVWVMIATIPSFLVAWFVPFKELEKDS
ncbi:MAG: MFS transporter [Ignavibacteriales bacterium]|nr:MFS transporter [Ignavibacteriales bacterium]MCB9260413.1 MFS transporter [Ignavibacteriales bacterium]